jgi:hypothetical protein
MLSPTIVLPAIGATTMLAAGWATYGTIFFPLWLIEAAGAVCLGWLAFRGVR